MMKITFVPSEEPYTEEELHKLLRLSHAPRKKTWTSAEAFLQHVRLLRKNPTVSMTDR